MNYELKREIRKKGLRQWQVADLLGISESHFCKLLRKELPKEMKVEIERILQGENMKKGEELNGKEND